MQRVKQATIKNFILVALGSFVTEKGAGSWDLKSCLAMAWVMRNKTDIVDVPGSSGVYLAAEKDIKKPPQSPGNFVVIK